MAILPRGPGEGPMLVRLSDHHQSHDAFGRARVSSPITLFDSKQVHDTQPLIWDDEEVSGSGTTSVYSANEARTRMGVGATTAGKRVRQTFQRFNYQPGKSQLIMMTGVLSETGTGIKACMGAFDDDNGIFATRDEGVLKFVIRSNVTGSPVDTEVTQSNFNGDPLDGTGDSAVTLDPSKTQILWFDYEWLGVGSVRMGFVIDGHFVLCHTFNHANTKDVVYMSTPNLPLRYSIENDGTGAATTMDHICSTVISEGGISATGRMGFASTAGTHVDANVENTVYAVVGIRLKSTHLGSTIDLSSISLAEYAGNNSFEWTLRWNPVVAGTFTYADLDSASAIQVATGATANTVTNGFSLAGGFGASTQKGSAGQEELENSLRLGAAIDGTRDTIVLCVRPVAGTTNLDVEGSITVKERA